MRMRSIILLIAFVAVQIATSKELREKRSANDEFKMCVPDDLLVLCEQMAGLKTKAPVKLKCVPARDRVECIEKIKDKRADFMVVDPEDMYVASNISANEFSIFEEIRTKAESVADYRFDAVAVIRKGLNINSLSSLKDLRSCHPGVGSTAGYKIPLTRLQQKEVIDNIADTKLSVRENELKALSQLFSKACIVGKWSAEPDENAKLKEKYSRLCALCEHPEICDYPDKYSGYEGTLRCLQNDGQIAWTTAATVKKYFTLPTATTNKPEDFVYLCPDGTKVPLTDTPCSWGSRPWGGYMTNEDKLQNIATLRNKLEELNDIGSKIKATWWEKVLKLDDTVSLKEIQHIAPDEVLGSAKYNDIIGRDYRPPYKPVRICTVSEHEDQKCKDFSKVAFARGVRPRFECIRDPENNFFNCFTKVRDDEADVFTIDYNMVDHARHFYAEEPIIAEQYGSESVLYYAVAVVKKGSSYKSLADLRGSKSCHSGIEDTTSFQGPVFQLMAQNLVKQTDCDFTGSLMEFFSGSCLPGVKGRFDFGPKTVEKLCSLCVGDIDKNDPSEKCNGGYPEAFSGDDGAFRCLAQGGGDVAFVKHDTIFRNTDGKNNASWAANLKSSDFELICPKGGRVPVEQYADCFIAAEPARRIIVSKWRNQIDNDVARDALMQAGQLFSNYPEYFKLFGTYQKRNNLLTLDSATNWVIARGLVESEKNFTKLANMPIACPSYRGP